MYKIQHHDPAKLLKVVLTYCSTLSVVIMRPTSSVVITPDFYGGSLGSAKRKSHLHTDADAFSKYSNLCARNVRQRCSPNLLQRTDSDSFKATHHFDESVFEKYSLLCARNATLQFSANATNATDVSSACKIQSTMTHPTQQGFTTTLGNCLLIFFLA